MQELEFIPNYMLLLKGMIITVSNIRQRILFQMGFNSMLVSSLTLEVVFIPELTRVFAWRTVLHIVSPYTVTWPHNVLRVTLFIKKAGSVLRVSHESPEGVIRLAEASRVVELMRSRRAQSEE